MQYTPRDYQTLAVSDAVSFLRAAEAGHRRLYAAPTGTGKSVIELLVQDAIPGSWIVTPWFEVIRGLLTKRGLDVPESEGEVLRLADSHRIGTPLRMRNRLLRGDGCDLPTALILDEAHHGPARSWVDLDLLLGQVPAVGFTASPYRGTPQGTAKLREQWGEPVWVLTYPEAAERGVIAIPRCEVVPLVDDDVIEIANGELVISQVEAAYHTKLDHIVGITGGYCAGTWDRPTMFSVPGTEIAWELTHKLNAAGHPAVCVTGDTSYTDRVSAFDRVIECRAALVQIKVVSEGVDLPIRRLIDLSPAISPVRWIQQVGRIMRPSDSPPHYVCTNRNLCRHAYLLDGCLPRETVAAAEKAFGGPGDRSGTRAVGLEALGRLKPVYVALSDGLTATAYAASECRGSSVRHYCAILHPCREEVLWAERESLRRDGETVAWGRWKRCEPPLDLKGFSSLRPSPISDKQRAWWKRSAARHGLNPDVEVTQKAFQVLPVLSDLREKL